MKLDRLQRITVEEHPAQITHVETAAEPKRVGVWFVGAQESLDFYGREADAVLPVVNAAVINIEEVDGESRPKIVAELMTWARFSENRIEEARAQWKFIFHALWF
ncbi:MAG: hypothetical protein EXQ47_01810 [Bryobacterales bacterium]|nr:hypothetical protein [Bryobacterales bacterium]